jgi:hypothetical protein
MSDPAMIRVVRANGALTGGGVDMRATLAKPDARTALTKSVEVSNAGMK